MGISGLLPVLKSITETKTLSDYRNKTLAIDGYCWLHRAIYSCSQEICLGQETDKYVTYFIERIDVLVRNGITPYVVFDGGPLPMKKGTEEERRKSRQKNKELGIQYFKQQNFTEARKCFVKAADVSPYMAHRVIQKLKERNVSYVVAPYEADAQLAFLIKNGLADGVITEDSDCLPFGCGTVLFKMDRDGIAQEIRTDNINKNKGMSFHMFTDDMFLEMCILSGCDYLPSLTGFGLKKAYAAVKQHGSFKKIIRALRLEGKVRIRPSYEAEFEKAKLTFRHQRVFDPKSQKLVTLTPIPADIIACHESLDFIGPDLSNEVAKAIAEGDMDPITMIRFPSISVKDVSTGFPSGNRCLSGPSVRLSWTSKAPIVSNVIRTTQATRPVAPQHRLSASFSQISASSCVQTPTVKSPTTNASNNQNSVTPIVSRFFMAPQHNKMSPADEGDKNIKEPDIGLSTYKSQDVHEVNVAKSISFDPLEEKAQQSHHDQKGKENKLPKDSTISDSTPPAPENAFSRMMRAGSMLQKQSLKRKTAKSQFCSRKLSKNIQTKTQTSLLHRIQQHAFYDSKPSDSASISTTSFASNSAVVEVDNCTVAAVFEKSEEPEVEPEEQAEPLVVRGAYLTDGSQIHDEHRETVVVRESEGTETLGSPIASFDRFRYQQ